MGGLKVWSRSIAIEGREQRTRGVTPIIKQHNERFLSKILCSYLHSKELHNDQIAPLSLFLECDTCQKDWFILKSVLGGH